MLFNVSSHIQVSVQVDANVLIKIVIELEYFELFATLEKFYQIGRV